MKGGDWRAAMPKERIYGDRNPDESCSNDLSIQWETLRNGQEDIGSYVAVSLVSHTDNQPFATVFLTRSSLNHAIRMLRKARDSAFGKDA